VRSWRPDWEYLTFSVLLGLVIWAVLILAVFGVLKLAGC